MAKAKQFFYHTSCVSARGQDITEMVDAATQITYETMRKHCDGLNRWAKEMGYGPSGFGLLLQDDWHVTYWKSKYRGKPCYYLCHSCIEYVWTKIC